MAASAWVAGGAQTPTVNSPFPTAIITRSGAARCVVVSTIVGFVSHRRVGLKRTAPVAAHPVLEIRNLSFAIGGRPILRDVSLTVSEGETVVLLGRSGSGKTTLLKAVNRLVVATSGEVHFEGRSTAQWDPIALR